MKASTTGCPLLVVTGLLMLFVTTSTLMPRSKRMPLVFLLFFTVILYNIMILYYLALSSYFFNPTTNIVFFQIDTFLFNFFRFQIQLSFRQSTNKKSVSYACFMPTTQRNITNRWLAPAKDFPETDRL